MSELLDLNAEHEFLEILRASVASTDASRFYVKYRAIMGHAPESVLWAFLEKETITFEWYLHGRSEDRDRIFSPMTQFGTDSLDPTLRPNERPFSINSHPNVRPWQYTVHCTVPRTCCVVKILEMGYLLLDRITTAHCTAPSSIAIYKSHCFHAFQSSIRFWIF
jgi:hypothetical protein